MKAIHRTLAVLLLFTPLLAGCGPLETEQPPDAVSVQLKWVHQAQFAGFYVAQEKGYYAQENIDVTLIEGGPDGDIVEQVVIGRADFGVAAPEDIIMEHGQGNRVVAIATIYRRNPTVFASLPGSGIERPADLLGRRVAAAGVVELELQLRAMLKRMGLDIHQVEIVPHSYDLTPLYDGQIDCIAVYSTGGLIRARQAGHELNLMWPNDYGIHMYADTLVTTDEMIAENPGLVTRFLRATLHGWREAVENPEMAAEMTLRYAREADPEMQAEMMEASVPMIHTGEDHIGWMRAEMWQGMHDILLEQGLLAGPVDMDQVYTMEFLQGIYGDE
jgi:NitT/TauT family transport system substrate-binding protein